MAELRRALDEVADKNEYLQHCCPTGNGQICEQSTIHWNAFFSHSDDPNCDPHTERFTAEEFRVVAVRRIARGAHVSWAITFSVQYVIL